MADGFFVCLLYFGLSLIYNMLEKILILFNATSNS